MGMMMLSPVLISLPFKLMLFVLVDGWSLVMGTLAAEFLIVTHDAPVVMTDRPARAGNHDPVCRRRSCSTALIIGFPRRRVSGRDADQRVTLSFIPKLIGMAGHAGGRRPVDAEAW